MTKEEDEMFYKFSSLKKILIGKHPEKKEALEKAEMINEDTASRNPDTIEKFCKKEEIDFDELLNIFVLQQDMLDCNRLLTKLMDNHHKDLKNCYQLGKEVFKKYIDMREYYYPVVSLWVIGTYFHNMFITYPYLFWNAMRGSGKTRTQNLISHLAKNGEQLVSLSESVLFRTAKRGGTLCLDEMESINSKDKQALRELLQAAYKKGVKVKRLAKVKTKTKEDTKESKKGEIEKESYEVEDFDVFCPISMANIRGMNDVLSDRCLTLILEKSNKTKVVNLMEIFSADEKIAIFKAILNKISVVSEVSVVSVEKGVHVYRVWNAFIYNINYTYTQTTLNTYNTLTTLDHLTQLTKCFDTIFKERISGRNLELSFPLLIIAYFCGESAFNEAIDSLKHIIKEKMRDDVVDSWDIALYEFIATKEQNKDFESVIGISAKFSEYIGNEIDRRWVGRALKRLGLVVDKRRIKKGIEVRLNYDKAIKNIKTIKPDFEVVVETKRGKYHKRAEQEKLLMPCKICGEKHSNGWQYEDTVDGKAVCDICAGMVEK